MYNATYKQVEVPRPKNEPKDSKSHEKIPEIKKSNEKIVSFVEFVEILPCQPTNDSQRELMGLQGYV